MRLSSIITEVIVLCLVCILWCEWGYYFFVFHLECPDWPGPANEQKHDNLTRVLVLSDIHIMGPRKSVKLDKWRREWQMKQSFRLSLRIYEPDLIIFLGDILDEGSFSFQDTFEEASNDFERIFYDASSNSRAHQYQRRIILLGNHDVGEHDRMVSFPFLLDRFWIRFGSTSSAELTKISDLNIVSINSMSLYNDSCSYCKQTTSALHKISNDLNKTNFLNSRPILLTHFPLYRPDDTVCDRPRLMKGIVKIENIEGVDVIHRNSSKFILDILRPRLVLSGHTHMDCDLKHEDWNTRELTISSYNHKYAEYRPSFTLLSANSTHLFSRRCYLVDEVFILEAYVLTFITVVVRSYFMTL